MADRADPTTAVELSLDQNSFFDDIYNLRRICSLLSGEIERALDPTRGTKDDKISVWTFKLSDDWIENVRFLMNEACSRSESLDDRRKLFDPCYRDE